MIQNEQEFITAIGQSKKDGITATLKQYRIQTESIAARTQLRDLLQVWNNPDINEHEKKRVQERLTLIITDATERHIGTNIALLTDKNGNIVASTHNKGTDEELNRLIASIQSTRNTEFRIIQRNGTPHVATIVSITRNFEHIGHILLIMYPKGIELIAQNYAYLGETGETIILFPEKGFIKHLTDSRFAGTIADSAINTHNELKRLAQTYQTVTTNTTDYRNVPVMAYSTNIPNTNWSLIVKKDISEILAPMRQSIQQFLLRGLFLFILSVSLGIITSQTITEPLRKLTQSVAHLTRKNLLINIDPAILSNKNEMGKLGRALLTAVTELKQSLIKITRSQALRNAMLSNIGDIFIAIHPNEQLIQMNDKGYELLHLIKNEHQPHTLDDIVTFQNTDGTAIKPEENPLSQCMHGTADQFQGQFQIKTKSGISFPARVSVSKITLKHLMFGYIITISDISREFEMDKAKTEFVSLASHQLRTPLSVIKWYCELLTEKKSINLTDEQKGYVHQIAESNGRMINLVNALLNVSRVETDTIQINARHTDINELIKKAIDDTQKITQTKNITIKHDLSKNTPAIITDSDLLFNVILNVVSNAIKFSKKQGEVTLYTQPISARDTIHGHRITYDGVLIVCTDHGYGIPQHEQKNIFTKLFRAENARKLDTTGSGLGLYLVKSILKLLNGNIWFESTKDVGSTFFITVPLHIKTEKKEGKTLEKIKIDISTDHPHTNELTQTHIHKNI